MFRLTITSARSWSPRTSFFYKGFPMALLNHTTRHFIFSQSILLWLFIPSSISHASHNIRPFSLRTPLGARNLRPTSKPLHPSSPIDMLSMPQNGFSCGTDFKCPGSPGSLICVLPDDSTTGSCQIACSLTSDEKPCPLGSPCQSLPQVSTLETGYCVNPTPCGGFAGIACPGNAVCVDDPRDDCDPLNGGNDCIGVCAANNITATETPEPLVNKACEVNPCPAGYQCIPNGKDLCDPARGFDTCSRLCRKADEKVCAVALLMNI